MSRNPIQTSGKSRSQRRLLVENNEDDTQFSFHEENR